MSVQSNGRRPKSRVSGPRAAAFFDLDGTLVDFNLVHASVFFLANVGEWTGRIGRLLNFAANIPTLYFAERNDRHLLNIAMFQNLRGLSRDRLEALGEEYSEQILAPRLYPQGVDVIRGSREAGIEPVLVTGSPEFLVAPLARQLGIQAWVANRLIFSNGRATGGLRKPVMAGSAKSDWCMQFAEANGFDLAASWGYADSYYDLPFLTALGHPVAVNPDRRLRVTARARQWPIMQFAKAQAAAPQARQDSSIAAWARRAFDGAS